MTDFLFREFFNHIYLGQWELARSCAFAIVKNDSYEDSDRQRLLSTLQNVSKDPHMAKPAWTTVPCPSYISFLSSRLLHDLGFLDEAKVWKEKADFNIFLELFFRKSKLTISELLSIYSHHQIDTINTSEVEESVYLETLSKQSFQFLKAAFSDNPSVISRFLQFISSSHHSKFTSFVTEIHCQHLMTNVKTLEAKTSKNNVSQDLRNKIYLLLSILPEITSSCDDVKYSEVLSSVHRLCTLKALDIHNVRQAFLCRPSPKLLKEFCQLQEKELSCNGSLNGKDLLCELKLYEEEGHFCHQKALLKTVNTSQHFLQDILEHSTKNIIMGNWEHVRDFVNKHSLSCLTSLMLILCWRNMDEPASVKSVVEAVKSLKQSSDDVLDEVCLKMKDDIILAELCIDIYKELNPDMNTDEIYSKIRNILARLQTQSILRVIHTTFGMKNVFPNTVHKILDVGQGHATAEQLSSQLTYREIFSGYLSVLSIIESIHLCCEFKNIIIAKKIDISSFLNKSNDSIDITEDNIVPDIAKESLIDFITENGAEVAYSKLIYSRIKCAKKHIKNISSVSFRVEILENIFSLLFSMSSVLLDSPEHGSDSDQGHEGEVTLVTPRKTPNENGTQSSESDMVYSGRFVISTVKLKDSSENHFSSHLSSKSTESNSSCGFQSHTFLCNELLTRDILVLTKELVLEAAADVYRTLGKGDSSVKSQEAASKSTDCILSSSDKNVSFHFKELPDRASKLLQHVNEALWRYEVVKSGIFHSEFNLSPLQKKKHFLLQSQMSASSSDGTDKEKKRKKKKKYKRSISFQRKEFFAESSIIQCMLSSPEALLRYSLWNRNLMQAKQVIKLFKLQYSSEAKEVILLEELQRIGRTLSESDKVRKTSSRTNSPEALSGTQSLLFNIQAIENAAATGLRSSELCLTVHQELSSLNVPEMIDITNGVRHPELLSGSENIYSVFLADLGCTSGASLDLSTVLLDMAAKSWSSSREVAQELDVKVLSKKKMPLIRGIFKTLHMMHSLVKELPNLFNKGLGGNLKDIFCPLSNPQDSFSAILPNFLGSLDCQQLNREVSNWRNVAVLLEHLICLLREEENDRMQAQADVVRENRLHITYKKLSKVVRDLRDWSSETIRPQQVKYENYLSKLLIHLHQVTSAVLDCKKQGIDTGTSIYTSDFSILKESPVELLKKIILQGGVTPDKIEKFAVRMKVDSVHVLAQACLPSVPLLDKPTTMGKMLPFQPESNDGEFPVLILNKRKEIWYYPRHPDLAAKELLNDLIAMLQDSAMANDSNGIFSLDELVLFTHHSKLESWMEDCSEIGFVDLELLRTKEEKLTFFINMTNIAWMHAIFYEVKTIQNKLNGNKSEISSVNLINTSGKMHFQMLSQNLTERLTIQKYFGYTVGQLGSMSLFDMRYVLLHAQLPVPKHLAQPPFYLLLGDPKEASEKYMPSVEPKALFVLVEGLKYSPKLQAIYSDHMNDILDDAMKDYFDFTIHINSAEEVVSLPKLLEWYALDFCKDDELDLDKASYEGLLNLLSSLVRDDLSDSFQALFSKESVYSFSENIDTSGKKQLPFVLKFNPPPLSFGIMLDYCSSDSRMGNETLTSKQTLPSEIQPIVLNYLKEKCSILYGLYEIFINNSPTDGPWAQESFCKESHAKSLFTTQENHPTLPVTYLLAFYKNLLRGTSDDRSWFPAALNPSPEKAFLSQQIETYFGIQDWNRALMLVDIYLEYFDWDVSFKLLRQLLLGHLSSVNMMEHRFTDRPQASACPCSYALGIGDPVYRANTVLQNVNKWTDIVAIQALKCCLADKSLANHPEIFKSLNCKLREVTLYKKIFDASEMFNDADVQDCVYVFNNWQEVADCSVWDQSRILDFLKSCEKYELSLQWSKLHVINKEQKMLALSMNVIWYLTQDPLKDQEVFDIMDSFENPSDCISLCDSVLPELPTVEAKLCIVQYLVDKHNSIDEYFQYYNMAMGLKMLSALKSPAKESYMDLVNRPYLLLEQMLMNLELKDAEHALNAIRDDLKCQTDMMPVMSLSTVSQLVEDYASKALEVHFLDALLDVSSSSTLVLSTEETFNCDESYMMPLRVPAKEEWVPDAKIQRCQVCKEERFNMFSRRHHCRRCGRVVCANCSQHALIVEGYGNIKVRVCDDCYNVMTGSLSLSTASFEKRYRVLSTIRSPSPRNSPLFNDNPTLRRHSSICIQGQQHTFRWVLSNDSEQNASVRNEFSYEQTPSISLCYSILKLHTDDKKRGQFMINLCDRLLGKIKARRSGKVPMEVDYNLMISMMKSLLMNAKVKLHNIGDCEGEALADIYFRHLEVVKLLVFNNCRHLIPREALTTIDSVRKLRDKLFEEERMHLALEISTKFNLEKTGVWSSWGMFCLRAGDWNTARSKFQQCLKVINDKNDETKENPLLEKILKVLETSKYPRSEKASEIFKSLGALKNITSGLSQFEIDMAPIDNLVKKECLFYLSMYGTHFATIGFYQKHGLISEALDYILNKKCDSDLFIEALFLPVLKRVKLSTLKHAISSFDPTLVHWSSYLFATCRYLERLKYLNVLYEIQLFMEDYARAAKSAINFYLSPATSYKTLFERQRYLYNAKKHYETYIQKFNDVKGSWRKRKNILILTLKQVESFIQVITFQEEVSKFLKLCEAQSSHSFLYESLASTSSLCPPTLFGNAEVKSSVAIMVLVNAVNIDDGFELSTRVIKAFNLNATEILCKAGNELVRIKQRQQVPHFLASVKCLYSKSVNVDSVILECITAISKQDGEAEDIIKMLTTDANKINAYLIYGKLKSAFLLAIKLNSALDVRRIMVSAEKCGQDSIQKICYKWLETNYNKLKSKEQASFKSP